MKRIHSIIISMAAGAAFFLVSILSAAAAAAAAGGVDCALAGDVAEVADDALAGDVAEVADDAIAGDVADVSDVAFAGDVAEVADVAFAGDVAEVADVAFAGDVAEVALAGDVADVADDAFTGDVAEVALAGDVADVADDAFTGDVAEVADDALAGDVAEVADDALAGDVAEVADVALAGDVADGGKPIVIAHRGGALLGNENSIGCLAAAVEMGVDMVEIDVHMTSDGRLVVCHDATIDRTTNGKGVIEGMTLDSLRCFKILDFKTGEPTDEMIPTLEEVLALVGGRCGVLLEIKKKKEQYEGIEAAVMQVIKDFEAHDWVVIQSFNDSVIEEVYRLDPTIPVEKLSVGRVDVGKYDYAAGINVHFAGKGFVKKCHAAGKTVKVWTINKLSQVPKAPVDGIITNRPDLFVK